MTSPSRVAVAGVSSDGLTTTVLPQASAGPTFQVISSSGRFHGTMTAMTPSGAAYGVVERPGRPAGVHAERLGGMLAEHVGEGREVGPAPGDVDVAGDRGLPVSRTSASRKSSNRLLMPSAIARTIVARSASGVAPPRAVEGAARAAATAASTSALPAIWAWAVTAR